jgi:hypothetical protein
MENPSDPALTQLQGRWTQWEVWKVRRLYGGPVWCARRRDSHKRILNADSAEHLAEHLTEAEACK